MSIKMKPLNLTYGEIKQLYEYCRDNMMINQVSPYFALLIYNNVKILENLACSIQAKLYDETNDPQFHECQAKVRSLIAQYVDRDEQCNPKLGPNGEPIITEMIAEFTAERAKVDEEYHDLMTRIMNKDTMNAKILQQYRTVSICCMNIEDMPSGLPPYIVGILTKET